ncbi:hypothetical protein GCM10010185_57220 [Saccharothrix coeruleofusca]|uniref:Phosphotransferase family enzyme n=1 Tax=Saccharothrix coeruleofusca TaxID=33919 RepID=A0A918EFU7_9PSEU|nr:hypothetical protein GCM10010185_57220 [Saccharothrix coeruleofusca]
MDTLAPEAVDVEDIAWRVLRAHLRSTGALAPDEAAVNVHTWIPAGARKVRRRMFIQVDVHGVPVGVAKVPLSEHDPKLAFEFDVLRRLAPGFPLAHPQPLERVGAGFCMTHLAGLDLPAVPGLASGPQEFWRVLRPVVDTVAALHLAQDEAGTAMSPEQAAAQYVRRPLFGVEHADRALRRARLGPTHGDLGPWNVRYDPEHAAVRILDFEDYRPVGVTGMDVLNLLVTCALVVFPDYRERGFDWLYEQVFNGDHWFPAALATGIRHYAAATGQSAAAVCDLTPLMCQWLIERITAEGRDTTGMFYRTFADRYLSSRPTWVGSLDD